jgi:hypothetical protein
MDALRDERVAAAVLEAVRLGIDDAVYRKQDKWRSFPATLIGVDLYALKIELEKSVEQAMSICLRSALGMEPAPMRTEVR